MLKEALQGIGEASLDFCLLSLQTGGLETVSNIFQGEEEKKRDINTIWHHHTA